VQDKGTEMSTDAPGGTRGAGIGSIDDPVADPPPRARGYRQDRRRPSSLEAGPQVVVQGRHRLLGATRTTFPHVGTVRRCREEVLRHTPLPSYTADMRGC